MAPPPFGGFLPLPGPRRGVSAPPARGYPLPSVVLPGFAMSGEIVHFEIPADDLERAKTFYGKTFGWKMNSMPDLEYTMVATGESDANGMPTHPGTINGGMLKRQAPVKSTVVTIMVDDMDVIAKAIEKNGGKILQKKTPIGDGSMGFAGYFRDPDGNVVGLFQRGPP
jgi:uncharacterized protein